MKRISRWLSQGLLIYLSIVVDLAILTLPGWSYSFSLSAVISIIVCLHYRLTTTLLWIFIQASLLNLAMPNPFGIYIIIFFLLVVIVKMLYFNWLKQKVYSYYFVISILSLTIMQIMFYLLHKLLYNAAILLVNPVAGLTFSAAAGGVIIMSSSVLLFNYLYERYFSSLFRPHY
ncbi:MAG: hypothetical protein WCW27_06365 [Patescibacteria group bacterium]|jgi:hypothetical protein